MKFEVLSKGILFDTLEITPYSNRLKFFEDKKVDNKTFTPVTAIIESDISEWLLKDDSVRNLIFGELKIPKTANYKINVVEPFIRDRNSKPGDIDILACDPDDPTHSVAFQCKRITVKPETFFTDQIGGLENAKEGVIQANAMAEKFTFSEVYLCLVIQVNAKDRTKFNQLCRSATSEQNKRIYSLPFANGVESKVGVIFIEVVQVTNRSFDRNGYVGFAIGKKATKRKQLSELSEKLQRYFN